MRARVTVGLADGLHGGPAARLREAALTSGHLVTVSRVGEPAVAASEFLAVTALGVRYGEQVEVVVTGPRAAEVLTALVALLRDALPPR